MLLTPGCLYNCFHFLIVFVAAATAAASPCRYFHLLQRPLSSHSFVHSIFFGFFLLVLFFFFSFCVIKSHFIAMPVEGGSGPLPGCYGSRAWECDAFAHTVSRCRLCVVAVEYSIFFGFFLAFFLGYLELLLSGLVALSHCCCCFL